MIDQPVSRVPKQATAYYFLLSLIGAALLMALGFIREGVLAPASGNQVQLSVVCVSGFSWDRGIRLHQGGKLPFIERLFRGKGSCGDIISSRSDPDPAIVASLFTGCFPGKYSRCQEADLMHFIAPGPFQKPVWQELAARGQQCLVVGLAVASGQEGSAAGAVAPGNTKRGSAVLTQKYLRRITGGARVPDDLLRVLQECVSSDLERTQQAVQALEANHALHLFSYFQGLGRWQQRLSARADALTESERSALIDNYYIFFDSILARLFSQCGSNGIFIVLSERGNSKELPAPGNFPPPFSGDPAPGFFYATGLHIRQGIEPLLIAPADLVPTLLYLTGSPLVNRLDGRVMIKLLEEHYYFKRKIIASTRLLPNK